jgi:hypothetical protein
MSTNITTKDNHMDILQPTCCHRGAFLDNVEIAFSSTRIRSQRILHSVVHWW